jgi:ribosomal protein S18 acetylase RimI-like enzyme
MLTRLPAGAEMICYACPSQNTAGQAFLLAKSFAPWFSEEVMQYPGPRLPDAGLVARPYTDADFETWTGTINQCFYPLRKANDIRPYIIFQHDQATRERLLNADSENLLFYDGDRLMGLGGIVGSEIDPVAVVAAERRKGYGRRIAAYCTNLILARGLSPVTLSVAQSNSAARQLYESVGFREVQRLQWFRLLLE